MATLDTKYISMSQPDGYADADTVRSRVFRQTATVDGTVNAGDALAASANYAVAKFPKGFIPRNVVVNVLKGNAAAANVTVNVAKDAADTANATLTAVNSGTNGAVAAVGTAGAKLIAVSAPWLTGENDYLVLTPAAAVDAEFEVVVIGDWPHLETET